MLAELHIPGVEKNGGLLSCCLCRAWLSLRCRCLKVTEGYSKLDELSGLFTSIVSIAPQYFSVAHLCSETQENCY